MRCSLRTATKLLIFLLNISVIHAQLNNLKFLYFFNIAGDNDKLENINLNLTYKSYTHTHT